MEQDLKNSVFLPKTNFPLRAGLAQKEPETLAFWNNLNLYNKIYKKGKNKKRFILHDGPPYANGHIHLGTATNKILKDIVNKCYTMLGYGIHYVPGWDCHGLPIEWKIEEQYREKGKDKDAVPVLQFRQECREFAAKWVDIQREEFKRLGVLGDWQNPYLTMTNDAEAIIAGEIFKFLKNGGLYRGLRPVMWSVVEKTALADAEIEYHDHKSNTIWVKFPIHTAKDAALVGASCVIWTTTPWTIPGNRAIAYGAELDYGLYVAEELAEESHVQQGEKFILATDLAAEVGERAKIAKLTLLKSFKGSHLQGTICSHPFKGEGYEFDVPALAAEFVTVETGTGLVHIAPGHGLDDFLLGKENQIEIPQTVGPDGIYYQHVPLFAGKTVYTAEGKQGDADPSVIHWLQEKKMLLTKGRITHSYPHSWRSKAPLIYRTTAQWFISLEKNDLRSKCLHEIDGVNWVPVNGRARIYSMIENRPDWCISRQRAWGVPIALFVNKETGEALCDDAVFNRITDIFRKEGSDAWYKTNPQVFLGDAYEASDYEQIMDVVDVWFESGATHAFVLEGKEDLSWPADLYLEGSDQHRGWFHSTLLESCGTRDKAPYKNVLTHGYVLDEKGYKMSKSLGNTIAPQKVIDQYGADILRLWVSNTDFNEDMRIGNDNLKLAADLYRRLRNTLRYLMGALDGFTLSEVVTYDDMPELEKWVLHRLHTLDQEIRGLIENYDFHRIFQLIHHFAAVELSAFYFDIRKDCLYCDSPRSLKRRSARTVMNELFLTLTTWLAPFCAFTAEEAWQTRRAEASEDVREKFMASESVHLEEFPTIPTAWKNTTLFDRWTQIRQIRRVLTGCLEVKRADKVIGSSLEASPVIRLADSYKSAVGKIDWAEIGITSECKVEFGPALDGSFTLPDVEGVSVSFQEAAGDKCDRCWRIMPEVKGEMENKLCIRCDDVLDELKQDAA